MTAEDFKPGPGGVKGGSMVSSSALATARQLHGSASA
jgi:hypothetical protein